MSETVLSVQNLTIGTGAARPAVNDVSLSVAKGEVLALIGQSGSGKTTLALAALGLVRPGLAVQEGQVRVCGTDMFGSPSRVVHGMRGRTVAYVAQSAAAAKRPPPF